MCYPNQVLAMEPKLLTFWFLSPVLKKFQRWRLHNLTKHPSPQFDCSHSKIYFSLFSMNLLLQFVFTASKPFQAWKEQMEHWLNQKESQSTEVWLQGKMQSSFIFIYFIQFNTIHTNLYRAGRGSLHGHIHSCMFYLRKSFAPRWSTSFLSP